MAMENVSYRARRRSLQNPRSLSAQAAACRAPEMDFSDVFGGPPRCSSAEVRRSLGDVFHGGSEDAVVPPARFTCPWAAASGEQLPVFGEESPSRRKHLSVDFFDDIFNGVDSNLMSARKSSDVSRHTTSVPASFVASPVHPSRNSGGSPLPRQHSLTNLARKLDSLASDATYARNLNRSPKGVTNSSPWPSYQTHSESQTAMQRNETLDGCVSQLQTEEAVKETPKENEQFHFSIYKWANNGIPLNDAFRGGYRRGSNIAYMQNGTSTGSATHVMKGEESPSVELLREQSGDQETGSAAAETFYSMFSRNDDRIADVGESMPTKSGAFNQPKHDNFIESEEKTKAVNQGRAEEGNMRGSENGSAVDERLDQEKRIEKNIESSENERMLPPKDIPLVAEEMVGSKVKGKVLQFVKMFSHEAPPKPAHNRETKAPKLKKNPSRKSKVEEKSNDDKVSQPFIQPERSSFFKRDSFGKSFDIAVELIEVEDITENQSGQNVATNHQEEIHILDAKIRKWSSGKEGNIRSLLSTLQYVLWADSGWKPVALVDIIEGGSVKKTYQKALLCLHPDKLQQKGATSQQKYIAEKVFDILQDAWTHFNLVCSL